MPHSRERSTDSVERGASPSHNIIVDRRANSAAPSQVEVSSFRFTLKDVIVVLGLSLSVGSSIFNLNSKLETTNSANALRFERLDTKLTYLESSHTEIKTDIDKAQLETKSLKEDLADQDRIISQLYLKVKEKHE